MNRVRAFYDSHAQSEWERLDRHRMEFALNMRMLEEHLPKPPVHVLDVGGGPGRYAITLAHQGYCVTLLDLSAECLAFARERAIAAGVPLAGIIHGNALDLRAFQDGTFDAVLLMGPMYHLLEQEDRTRALREAHRVLKPDGILATAFINRYATILVTQPEWVVRNAQSVRRELETGVSYDQDGHFTDVYSTHPADVKPLLEQNGFYLIEMIASEGLRTDLNSAVQLTGEAWTTWIDLNYRLVKDPTVQGASIHLLAIARKA